ncbi:MAG: hypothetical protein Q8P90_03665 [bacterium]|nr:hypothetical protein [bacterium]
MVDELTNNSLRPDLGTESDTDIKQDAKQEQVARIELLFHNEGISLTDAELVQINRAIFELESSRTDIDAPVDVEYAKKQIADTRENIIIRLFADPVKGGEILRRFIDGKRKANVTLDSFRHMPDIDDGDPDQVGMKQMLLLKADMLEAQSVRRYSHEKAVTLIDMAADPNNIAQERFQRGLEWEAAILSDELGLDNKEISGPAPITELLDDDAVDEEANALKSWNNTRDLLQHLTEADNLQSAYITKKRAAIQTNGLKAVFTHLQPGKRRFLDSVDKRVMGSIAEAEAVLEQIGNESFIDRNLWLLQAHRMLASDSNNQEYLPDVNGELIDEYMEEKGFEIDDDTGFYIQRNIDSGRRLVQIMEAQTVSDHIKKISAKFVKIGETRQRNVEVAKYKEFMKRRDEYGQLAENYISALNTVRLIEKKIEAMENSKNALGLRPFGSARRIREETAKLNIEEAEVKKLEDTLNGYTDVTANPTDDAMFWQDRERQMEDDLDEQFKAERSARAGESTGSMGRDKKAEAG